MPATIHPVILSGGAGTRLWPLSRELYPKQLLPLASDRSLLQETTARAAGDGFAPPMVVCNEEHRFLVAEQLRASGHRPQAIILEPVGRNTAPAVAAAAILLARSDPGALMLVLPSDHVVTRTDRFAAAVQVAAKAAAAGRLVTFGIAPTGPETGYGYIHQAAAIPEVAGAYAVERFVEKPDAATAQAYLAAGGWSWNSGMFLFPVELFLEELVRHEPEMTAAVRTAVSAAQTDLDFTRLAREPFERATAKSIDYAVMERTAQAAVVPADLGWSDVGAWSALWEIGAKDAGGNVHVGDVVSVDSTGSYLRGEGLLVAGLGLKDMVVVATRDAVMVAPRDRVQEVKRVVDALKAQKRSEASAHRAVYRPWGYYQSIDAGDRFQVKHITVNPGAKLSLQKHAHRAEHWIVVNGKARVTRDEDVLTLRENQSTYIPLGAVHRLENPGPDPLTLIEVQSGGYLGEDDIVRLDDVYGRS